MTQQSELKRPQPFSMNFTKPYWDATRDKRLVLQYCPTSRKYQHYPRPVSVHTGRRDVEWREVDGSGVVYAYTVTRRGPEAFRRHEPYLIATIQLDADVLFMANVVNCPIDAIKIGMRVKPNWEPLPDGTHLLQFEPESLA
jgi:uncharacterized OB-fold protein